VDLDYGQFIGSNLFLWAEELTQLLKKKVDVVPEDSLFNSFRPYVETDKRLVYEKPSSK
jgi:predicted nucleotidyltransferase